MLQKEKNLIYPAQIVFCTEDKVFSIRFPNFPEIISDAETLEEAKLNAKEALSLYLDSLVDDNLAFPEPVQIKDENIFYIEAELGNSTYTKYHKKSYEKNKDEILSKKKTKSSELVKNGFTNFKTYLKKDTVNKLNIIIKEKKITRQDFLTYLIEKEFANF